MKLFYLTFQEDASLYLGVTRKIAWQAHAFEALGYEVTYTLWKGHDFLFFEDGKTQTLHLDEGRGLMHQFAQAAEVYIEAHHFDILYFRLDRISFDALRLCRLARKRGAKTVIIEIPNYPYLKDYVRNIRDVCALPKKAVGLVKILGTAAQDRVSGLSLRNVADAVVLIGNRSDRFFGVKAVNITNGIDVDAFRSVSHKETPKEKILVGVAGTLWWQGYDRLLRGLRKYRDEKSTEDPHIRFILVGGDPKEMPEFLGLVKELGLQDNVECPGFLTGKDLAAVYERADIGISSLGCYRRGLTRCSSLKAREYCAAGIPFLYAYDDEALEESLPFAMKIPNDPSPVDIKSVVRFIESCQQQENLVRQEREFAREHYDWKAILKRVLIFAGARLPK